MYNSIFKQKSINQLQCSENDAIVVLKMVVVILLSPILWDQNTLNGVTLFVYGAWNEKIARKNDVFIMDKLSETPRSVVTMEKLNNIRLWLQVSRLIVIW